MVFVCNVVIKLHFATDTDGTKQDFWSESQ